MALVTFHAACHSSILCRPRPNSPPPDESSSKLPSSMLNACGVLLMTPSPSTPPSRFSTPPYDDSSELHVVRNGFVSGLPPPCNRFRSASTPSAAPVPVPADAAPAAALSPRRFMMASTHGLSSGT